MPGKTPASLMLLHIADGSVVRHDGRAVDALVGAMQEKHGMDEAVVLKTLQWCVEQGLVQTSRCIEGVCMIEVTSKYRRPNTS